MLFAVAGQGSDDDRQTVDLAAFAAEPPDPEAFAEDPQTVLDDTHLAAELDLTPGPIAAASILTPAPIAIEPATAPILPPATLPTAPAIARPDADRGPDPVHQLPTQQIPTARRASSSMSKHSASTTTTSPVDAMKFDEIARTRIFLKIVLALCTGGIIVAISTGGDHVAKLVVLIGSIGSALSSLVVLAMLRDVAGYDQRKLLLPGLPIVFGSMAGVYYWGTASPVAAMLVYGIYFFSLASSARITTGMYALIATLHGLLGLGIIFGVVVDRGVVQMSQLRTLDQVTIVCIIEALYFMAFYTARVSQRVTLDAMTKLEQAVRSVSQRDALLAEARAELDRALVVGGPGRYSEQVVGAFRLGILIGRGGMGEVYEASRLGDLREAAVKLLHPTTLAEPTHVQRFLREAQTA